MNCSVLLSRVVVSDASSAGQPQRSPVRRVPPRGEGPGFQTSIARAQLSLCSTVVNSTLSRIPVTYITHTATRLIFRWLLVSFARRRRPSSSPTSEGSPQPYRLIVDFAVLYVATEPPRETLAGLFYNLSAHPCSPSLQQGVHRAVP